MDVLNGQVTSQSFMLTSDDTLPPQMRTELDWRARENIQARNRQDRPWHLENRAYWQAVIERGYDGKRLGLSPGAGVASMDA